MNKIKIKNLQKKIKVNQGRLRALAEGVLCSQGVMNAEVSVLLVNDARIRTMNRRFLKKDTPTDVIAFRMADGVFAEVHPELLGDVIISLETAWRQSRALQVALPDEINLYLTHGLLHLLGYVDTTKKGFRIMEKTQKELIKKYAPAPAI
jgi:probable rRNA maturation factor